MNYTEIKAYLKQVSVVKFGLERAGELARRLGNPQHRVNIIHIAGTNGKGSVGAMLASVLCHAGYRTGHFTSPALLGLCDYFRIDNQVVAEALFTEIMTEVIVHAEQMQDKPTEFEILAVAAYLIFERQGCDFAVMECCMGGDMDCTNIITNPVLSIITNIQKDHCTWLGNRFAEIAVHKAGIIKQGCPVLTGTNIPEALQVITEKAACLYAPCYQAENLIQESSFTLDGTDLYCTEYGKLLLSLLGVYQRENVNLVLNAVRILRNLFRIPEDAVRSGLADCHWRGRFELFSKEPYVIFDGAHNPDGIQHAIQSIARYFSEKSILIMGVMADKNYAGYGELLKNYVSGVFTVRPDNPRSLDPEILKSVLQESISHVAVCDSVAQALRKAYQNSSQIICLGSLYFYREFYQAMQEIAQTGWE